jgi:hypothetical protein
MRDAEDALELVDETTTAGHMAAASIRPLVPVRTSRLLNELREVRGRVGDDPAAGVESTTDYVIPVHYGTVHMEAQPFGTEGLEAAARPIEALYLQGIEHALELVKGA